MYSPDDEEKRIIEYMAAHPELKSNSIINSFLENPQNFLLFKKVLLHSSKEARMLLDEAFQKHYRTLRFTSYISKYLYYESINFDKKMRRHHERQMLTLDAPASDDSGQSYIQMIREEKSEYLPHQFMKAKPDKLEDFISNEKLLNAVSSLTENQKLILKLAYVDQLKDIEIAKRLNKSQQAISKSHQKALGKIRECFNSTWSLF